MDESVGEDIDHFCKLWPEINPDEIRALGNGGYARCYSLGSIVLKRYTEEGLRSLRVQFKVKRRKNSGLETALANLIGRLPEKCPYTPKIMPEYCKKDTLAYELIRWLTLEEAIWNTGAVMPFHIKARIALAIADPIIYLQQRHRVHGDFTPTNIVLKGLSCENGRYVQRKKNAEQSRRIAPKISLIDWDHTQEAQAGEKGIFAGQETITGTRLYAPSEYLSRGRYEPNSETEPLGKIWYEMFCGETLIKTEMKMSPTELILYGDELQELYRELPKFRIREDIPYETKQEIKSAIRKTLQPSYRRPPAAEAKEELRRALNTPARC